MTQFFAKTPFVILILSLLLSCKKETKQPEEPENVYPRTLNLSTVLVDGSPSLYSNAQNVNDPNAANTFIEPATSFVNDYYPAKSVTFLSKDSMAFTYVTNLGTGTIRYGVQKNGDKYRLISSDSYPATLYDTSLIEVFVNNNTGLVHSMFTASGDFNELKVSAFAYRLRQYEIYHNEVRFKYEVSSMYTNAFKEACVNSLTSLDTLGIQRYNVVYK